jgi:flagellar biosynthetic protein FlhB
MAQQQEQDRSEAATPFKLQEARRRGQVAKSPEFSAWLMLLVAVLLGWTMFKQLASAQLRLSRALFDQSGRIDLTLQTAQQLFSSTLLYLLSMSGVLLAIVMLTALAGSFLQIGPVFSMHPLKPDFTRLNPVTGFKRVFNLRMVYEALKTVLKLLLVVGVLYVFFQSELPRLLLLQAVDVRLQPVILHDSLLKLAMMLLTVLGFVAVFDLGFVKWEFARKMRMSRREVREEVKRRDGDPRIKAKIRELQREAARRGASVRKVPEADVLITNPTHLSVAVKYERGRGLAPLVIAKGAGDMALRMRWQATKHRVPVIEHRPVAQLLFRSVPIDGAIPPESYADVARLLTWAYRQRGRNS